MAKGTSSQTLASASNAAAGTASSSWSLTNDGVSGVGMITNGGTGPTVACDFVIQVSPDNGTTVIEWSRQTAGTSNSGVYRFPFGLGIGSGADWQYWRAQFTGNTAQAVTVQMDAESTTGL